MTQEQRAAKAVDAMLHKAHLSYQRQQLRAEHVETPVGVIPCSEVRGVRRKIGVSEQRAKEVFRPEWFTHLRPNFWRGYFETLVVMARR